MLGILFLLMLSYLLLRYFKQYHDPRIFLPGRESIGQVFIGASWPVLYFCLFEYSLSLVVNNPYQLNPGYSITDFMNAVGYVLRSVVYEELVFRGVLFFLIWKKYGSMAAIIISGVCFGIYHWFAWQALGNPAKMVIVFLTTGSVGLLLGFAFVRSKSMYLPIALHFGANLANMVIFSKDHAIGTQMFLKSFKHDQTVPPDFIGLPFLLLHFIGYQCLTFLVVRWITKFKKVELSL